MQLDADDVERITHLDLALVRRRIEAVRALPIPRGTAEGHFLASVRHRRAIDLSPAERHQLAVLCWAWRRRGLERGLAPQVNPNDPLSPDQLALATGCTPTLALARAE